MCDSIALAHADRLPEALACLDAGLRIDPGFIPCLLARARLLADLRRYDAALADLDAVLARAPLPDALAARAALLASAAGDPEAHLARGNALYALGRFPEAIAAYDCLLAQDGGTALAWYNRGNALQKDGQLDAALDAYRQACAIVPDFAEAWLEQAHCRLAQGAFEDGWPLYEWRWRTPQLASTQLASAQPRRLGGTDLDGRTILLWTEQGHGDTIQFARFIPRVADRAGTVIVRAPAALRALLATVDARVTVIGDDAALPPHDLQCPLMSLPLALGVGADVAPAGAAYLHAAPVPAPAGTGRPRIGLCWSGRKTAAGIAYNPGRDIPLAALAPLAGIDADIVCLQPDATEDDAALLAGWPNVVAPPRRFASFADTAALVAGLDLVISVDSAVAHLAGALGVPCRLLLRRAGEWRWQRDRADSPWYPALAILRQQVEGDWDGVVGALIGEVTGRAQS